MTAWIDLGDIMLNEISQKRNVTCYQHIFGIEEMKPNSQIERTDSWLLEGSGACKRQNEWKRSKGTNLQL